MPSLASHFCHRAIGDEIASLVRGGSSATSVTLEPLVDAIPKWSAFSSDWGLLIGDSRCGRTHSVVAMRVDT
jgi:hypothetical protein